MHVLSPYGKPVVDELRTVYGLDGPEAAREFVLRHIERHYGLDDSEIESLAIAFGLCAKINAGGECFYLKFTSKCIHQSPDELFPWLEYACNQDVPVPEILRSGDGDWFKSPLPDSSYDVVYLMREIPGTPMPTPRENELSQYATAMAHFHEVGATYPHRIAGRTATWNSKLKERERLWQQANQQPLLSPALLTTARELVEETGESDLSTTIVHGDFRFCHVLFDEGNLTGLIDVDTSTTGERWVDYCAGLLSGNSPERGNLLDFEQLRQAMTYYHERRPLDASDQSALRATFAYAAVETLYDLSQFVAAGTTDKDDIESLQTLLDRILQSSDLL